jgi:hypothetical protein
MVDNGLFEEELNIQEQSILIALIRYYNKEKGYSYPSYARLKKASRVIDNRTLINNINSLIKKGYLKKETVKGIGNKYYIVKFAPSVDLHLVENYTTCKSTPTPSVDLHHDLVENYTTTNTNTNTNTKTIIYTDIFNHWNSKKIQTHKQLSKDIEKAIDKALKIKIDGVVIADKDIKKAIDNYKEVLESDYYFKHKWTLIEFLTRKQKDTSLNQLVLFMNNGSTYENYKQWLQSSMQEAACTSDKPRERMIET